MLKSLVVWLDVVVWLDAVVSLSVFVSQKYLETYLVYYNEMKIEKKHMFRVVDLSSQCW